MNTQSTFQTVGQNFKSILLASLLYPLERIQSIQQIQSTFSSPKIKGSDNIVGQAVHYGRKSYFRGFMPFLTKTSLLTAAAKVTDLSEKSNTGWGYEDSLALGLGLLGYCMLYPFEIVNLHMSVEVDQQRFYSNVRQCVSKIKINQGVKTLYRAFFYSSTIFTMQLASVKYGWKLLEKDGGKEYSQWQKIGIIMGLVGISEVFFYPFNTVKKLLQINGAIGHSDSNFSIWRVVTYNNLFSLFRGLSTRLSNIALYSLLYCAFIGDSS